MYEKQNEDDLVEVMGLRIGGVGIVGLPGEMFTEFGRKIKVESPAEHTTGGGSLVDMGGHCIDLLEMFFGELKAVSCFINNTVHDYESEDSATAMLFFANGALATVDTFFCIPDNSSKNVLELYGSKGSILAKGTIGQAPAGEMVAFLEESEEGYDAKQARKAVEGQVVAPDPVNTYMAEIREFSAAVLEGREPENSAELGLQSQKALAACYKSARKGKVVEL